MQQHTVKRGIFLFAVNRNALPFGNDARTAHIKSGEMGGQPDYRLVFDSLPVLEALNTHHALNAFFWRPPQNTMLQETACDDLKVFAGDAAAFTVTPFGKTQLQIGQCDIATLSRHSNDVT